ncbi:MAG: Dna2/Cas4 domain-containing protein, partial [archaeon]
MPSTKITGTLIKNYMHCKRQAWLYYHGINFQNE